MPPNKQRSKRVSVDQLDQTDKKFKVDNVVDHTDNTDFSAVLREVIGDEIEELEMFVKSKHRQVKDLEHKCGEYSRKLEENQTDCKSLESKNKKMRESMAQYENLRRKYDLQLESSKEELSKEYSEKLKDLEEEKKCLQEKLSIEMNSKAKWESTVIEKDEKISNFRKQFEFLSKKCKENDKVKGEESLVHVEKYKSRIGDLELENEELSRKVDGKDAQIHEQEIELTNVKHQLIQSQEEETKLKMECADMLKENSDEVRRISEGLEEEKKDKEFFKNKLCENEDTLKQKDVEMKHLGASVKDEITFFTEERIQLKNHLASIKRDKEQLEVQNQEYDTKVHQMEGELRHMEEMFRSGNFNDEDLIELKEKFKTLEDINKILENKSENADDALFEMKKTVNILTEDLSAMKEIHSKCRELTSVSSDLDKETIKDELRLSNSNFDILLSQKNIAESRVTILDRKVKKLETNITDVEYNLKMEMENYKLVKEDEFVKFKQNFNPAAMKTISVLKEENQDMYTKLETYKADLKNLNKATDKYKSAVDKYKLDLYRAEKSALESSIFEHKEVLDSLQKMPEKYRRKTLKKLYEKSSDNDTPAMETEVTAFKESRVDLVDIGKTEDLAGSPLTMEPSVLDLSVAFIDNHVVHEDTELNKNEATPEPNDSSLKASIDKSEWGLNSPKETRVKESPAFAAFLDKQNSAVKKPRAKTSRPEPPKLFNKYEKKSSENYIVTTPECDFSVPSFGKDSLLDSIDKFTSMTKQKSKESERKVLSLKQYKEVKKNALPAEDPYESRVKSAVGSAIEDLERKGFFREGKIAKSSTEVKFSSYFLRKFKDSDVSIEMQKSEIIKTLRMYADRIREKNNKTK